MSSTATEWHAIDWEACSATAEVDEGVISYIDRGDGPAVMLIHGLGGSWENWVLTLPELSASHRALAPDLPGSGRSTLVGGEVSIAGFARSVGLLADRLDLERLDVVGHSMGALVALELALAQPARVGHLVLVSPAPDRRGLMTLAWVTQAVGSLRASDPHEVARTPEGRIGAFKHAIHRPDLIDAGVAQLLLEAGARSPAYRGSARAITATDVRDRVGAIRAPTLIVGGAHDEIARPRDVRPLAAAIPGARLELWDDVSHLAPLEQPARFNALLEEFLAA